MNEPQPNSPALSVTHQTIDIPRSDRWQVSHRLQELGINCACLADGSFSAEINSPIAAIQLWSVIYQLNARRPDMIDQLQRCWRLTP